MAARQTPRAARSQTAGATLSSVRSAHPSSSNVIRVLIRSCALVWVPDCVDRVPMFTFSDFVGYQAASPLVDGGAACKRRPLDE